LIGPICEDEYCRGGGFKNRASLRAHPMRPHFSEFSFGFALSFEIANAFRPWFLGVPTFPSLVEERERGYDVKFPLVGTPVFLQFKLSEFMKSRRAKYWPNHGSPFYRMAIYKRRASNQHNRLKELSNFEPEVYYAAPAFHKEDRFQRLFASNEIISATAFIPVRGLPPITDNLQHYVTFCDSGLPPLFQWHSNESTPIEEASMGREWLESLHRRIEKPRDLGERFFLQLRTILYKIIVETANRRQIQMGLDWNFPLGRSDEPRSVFREIGFLLATYFGVQMFLLTREI
jgi:hypothetical protein